MSHVPLYQPPGPVPSQQFPMSTPRERAPDAELSSYLNILFEQRWLIAVVAAAVMLAGVAYAFMATPTYEANVLIHVEEQDPKEVRNLLTESGSMFSMKTSASAEIEMFQSRLVISSAVDKLNLHISGEPKYLPVIGKWLSRYSMYIPQPDWIRNQGYAWAGERMQISEFQVPEDLLNRPFDLVLEAGNRYRIVEPLSSFAASGSIGEPLMFDMPEGQFKLLINKVDARVGTHFVLRHASRQVLISDILRRIQVNELGKQSGIIRATLQGDDPEAVYKLLQEIAKAYIHQNGRRKTQEADAALAFLQIQLPETKKQMDLAEARHSQFRNQNSTVDLGEEAKIALQQSSALKTRKLELNQKRLELLTRFMPEHPFVKGVDAQLAEVNDEIRKVVGGIKMLPQVEQSLVRLTRDVKVHTDLYVALLNTARQLQMATVAKTSNVRLVDMPIMPEKPVSPNRVRAISVSLLAGLMLGIVVAFITKSLQSVINDPDKIEEMMGVPVYAAIPLSKAQAGISAQSAPASSGSGLLANRAPMDIAVEGLRSFRTVLQYALPNLRGKILLITGPTAGTGKSFVSANLASLLGSGGKRVLLIDGDLRNGNLHHCFGVGRQLGLSEDVIHREVLRNVDFLSTGALVEDSSELLMRPVVSTLMASLEAKYDIVLIDSAPLLAVSDSILLGMHASAIYLLTRAGITTPGEIADSLKRLAQAGLSAHGLLFNGLVMRSRQYGYGHAYSRYWPVQYLNGRSIKAHTAEQ
jgi:tyrosine-protein kinase Etk/Wzc